MLSIHPANLPYCYSCAYLFPPPLFLPLPPFFPPFSISFPFSSEDAPKSWANCFRITQGLFRIRGISGFCICGQTLSLEARGASGDWRQGTGRLRLHRVGQSLQCHCSSWQERWGAGGELWDCEGDPRDADIGVFEKTHKIYQADKWKIRRLLVERLTYRKKPRHETMGCVQRPICSSSLIEHKI